MKASKAILAMVALLFAEWLADTARADFTLFGDGQLTVNTYHYKGMLLDQSEVAIVSGGLVGYLDAYDTSTMSMSGGSVNCVQTYNSSTVDISGGSVSDLAIGLSGYLFAHDASTVDVSGGWLNCLRAYGTSTVDISGGSVSTIAPYNSSTVRMSGGSADQFDARQTSTVDISGGSVNYFSPSDTVTVNISGGSVNDLRARDNSTVTISGGSVPLLYAWNTSTVTFNAWDIRVHGGLSLDGDRVLGTGVLTGKWFGGTASWATTISYNDAGATILVPEPATLSLLALLALSLPKRGGLAMIRRRGKK